MIDLQVQSCSPAYEMLVAMDTSCGMAYTLHKPAAQCQLHELQTQTMIEVASSADVGLDPLLSMHPTSVGVCSPVLHTMPYLWL